MLNIINYVCVYTHERTRISRVCVFTHARDTRVRETHTLSLTHSHTHRARCFHTWPHTYNMHRVH